MIRWVTISILVAITTVLSYREYQRHYIEYCGLQLVTSSEWEEVSVQTQDVHAKMMLAASDLNARMISVEKNLQQNRMAMKIIFNNTGQLSQKIDDMGHFLTRNSEDGAYLYNPPKPLGPDDLKEDDAPENPSN